VRPPHDRVQARVALPVLAGHVADLGEHQAPRPEIDEGVDWDAGSGIRAIPEGSAITARTTGSIGCKNRPDARRYGARPSAAA
ncbi:MAG: hypothetical protein ACREFS_14475, partial [Acetobacteraceae bacterium]